MTYVCHWSGWRVIAIGIPLALAATVLSCYGMEKPVLKFKTRFAAKTRLSQAVTMQFNH